MKRFALFILFFSLIQTSVLAQNETIDISGNNTSSSYVTYDKDISIPASKTVDVLMSRYTYFNSKITGTGVLNLYAGAFTYLFC